METKLPVKIELYGKLYSSNRFWRKVKQVAQKAGVKVIYVALLLYYVLQSSEVSMADKTKIVGALGYFILPLDVLPDTIPIMGFSDDLAALYWAFHSVSSNVTPEMETRARQQIYRWFGDLDAAEFNIG